MNVFFLNFEFVHYSFIGGSDFHVCSVMLNTFDQNGQNNVAYALLETRRGISGRTSSLCLCRATVQANKFEKPEFGKWRVILIIYQ